MRSNNPKNKNPKIFIRLFKLTENDKKKTSHRKFLKCPVILVIFFQELLVQFTLNKNLQNPQIMRITSCAIEVNEISKWLKKSF